VQVTVLEVDPARKRIALSMRTGAARANASMDGSASKSGVANQPARSMPAPKAARKPQPAQPAREGWFSAGIRDAKGRP
jgi:uncharacterized protein